MKTVIEMAREAGFAVNEKARQHQPNCIFHTQHMVDELLERFAELVRADEREQCAKVIEEAPCECCWPEGSMPITEDLAAAIRARK